MARMNTDAKYMPLYAKREIFCKGTAISYNTQYLFYGIFLTLDTRNKSRLYPL
jgi:hypothetical protein